MRKSEPVIRPEDLESVKHLMEAVKFLWWLEKQLPETLEDENQGQRTPLWKRRGLSTVINTYCNTLPERDGCGKKSREEKAKSVEELTKLIRKGLKEIES